MTYRCPVCFYDNLPYPPRDYHICPCCGTEFGNDDAELSHGQLRELWIASGAHWFFGTSPPGWNKWIQLASALEPEGFRVPIELSGTESEDDDNISLGEPEFHSAALIASAREW